MAFTDFPVIKFYADMRLIAAHAPDGSGLVVIFGENDALSWLEFPAVGALDIVVRHSPSLAPYRHISILIGPI